MVIVVGGDIGLSGSDQPVSAKGAYRHGARYDWADLTRHLGLLVNGDINFANLETVVTDKNSLPPTPKKFRFRSHPVGVQHLVKLGFNAFSLANNHAIDYGHAGMRETLRNIASLKQHGLALTAGLGMGDNAFAPAIMSVRGAQVALAAVGIGGVSPRNGRVGMAGFHSDGDFLASLHSRVVTAAV
ncbi:MAG: CapA family protein, partial [Hyphomicrobiaceae bacterium]|nr:CapA family protein [Hyphomicrobiaceae bacterium]